MTTLPPTGTHKLVLDAIQRRIDSEEPREYLGGSILGTQCDRQLWYQYHDPKRDHPPRVQMIFDMGNNIEDYIIRLLRESGLTIYDQDANGNQFGFVDGFIAGHIDGVIVGLPESDKPHLLEIKSANNKRFGDFQKKGCQVVESKYWGQMHVYMHKMGLEKALLVVMNKDNCELYFERVTLDPKYADSLMLRGEELVAQANEKDVRKKYKKSTSFGCKFCNWKDRCWKEDE